VIAATGDRPVALAAVGLARPAAAPRLRAGLHRAEQRFVAEVVRDGGIGPWRTRVVSRLCAARDAVRVGRLSRAETASLVVALTDRPTRDRCWELIEQDGADEWLPLWRHLVRHALPPYRVEVLFLLGWSSWRRGSDALARTAVEAVLAEDRAHRAGHLLATLLRANVPSAAITPLTAGRRDRPAQETT
jgi:hypothetical protein